MEIRQSSTRSVQALSTTHHVQFLKLACLLKMWATAGIESFGQEMKNAFLASLAVENYCRAKRMREKRWVFAQWIEAEKEEDARCC